MGAEMRFETIRKGMSESGKVFEKKYKKFPKKLEILQVLC
jgi:hypothetical protein